MENFQAGSKCCVEASAVGTWHKVLVQHDVGDELTNELSRTV